MPLFKLPRIPRGPIGKPFAHLFFLLAVAFLSGPLRATARKSSYTRRIGGRRYPAPLLAGLGRGGVDRRLFHLFLRSSLLLCGRRLAPNAMVYLVIACPMRKITSAKCRVPVITAPARFHFSSPPSINRRSKRKTCSSLFVLHETRFMPSDIKLKT